MRVNAYEQLRQTNLIQLPIAVSHFRLSSATTVHAISQDEAEVCKSNNFVAQISGVIATAISAFESTEALGNMVGDVSAEDSALELVDEARRDERSGIDLDQWMARFLRGRVCCVENCCAATRQYLRQKHRSLAEQSVTAAITATRLDKFTSHPAFQGSPPPTGVFVAILAENASALSIIQEALVSTTVVWGLSVLGQSPGGGKPSSAPDDDMLSVARSIQKRCVSFVSVSPVCVTELPPSMCLPHSLRDALQSLSLKEGESGTIGTSLCIDESSHVIDHAVSLAEAVRSVNNSSGPEPENELLTILEETHASCAWAPSNVDWAAWMVCFWAGRLTKISGFWKQLFPALTDKNVTEVRALVKDAIVVLDLDRIAKHALFEGVAPSGPEYAALTHWADVMKVLDVALNTSVYSWANQPSSDLASKPTALPDSSVVKSAHESRRMCV